MTTVRGGWGFAKWGVDVWGWLRFGVPFTGQVVSAALINAITQAIPTPTGISARVLIDGVDYSTTLESVSTSDYGMNSASKAELSFFASDVAAAIPRKSLIQVIFDFDVGGKTFSASIFRGKVYEKKKGGQTAEAVTKLTCFDASRILDEEAPAFTTHTGSALTLIRSELFALGITSVEASWTDFTVTALSSSGYKTVRDLIKALVNGKRKGYAFLDSDGTFQIIDAYAVPSAEWSIPLSGQTRADSVDNSGNVFNRVIVFGNGISTTYNDTEHQETDDNGILETEVVAPFCTTAGEVTAFGTMTANESQANVYEIETPVNPFVVLGSSLGIEEATGGFSARVEEIRRSFSWPNGAWQVNVLREPVPLTVPAAAVTTILDTTDGGWYPRSVAGVAASWKDSFYPTFTLAAATKIQYIEAWHHDDLTPGIMTLRDTGTMTDYDFTLSISATDFTGTKHYYSDSTGVELPAGDYQVRDSKNLTWCVLVDYPGKANIIRLLGPAFVKIMGVAA